jgi:hypothetical protein
MQTNFKLIVLTTCLMHICIAPSFAKDNRKIDEAVQAARSAGVSESVLNRLLTDSYRYSIDEDHFVRWIGMVGHAASQNLPAAPLAEKLEEGLSKKISPNRISGVLAQQLKQLQLANHLLRGHVERGGNAGGAMERIADLVSAGLTPYQIQNVLDHPAAAGLHERLEALTLYAVFSQSGLRSDYSDEIIASGLENRYFNQFPVDLAFMVKHARSRHIPDERIAAEALKVVDGRQTVQDGRQNLHLQNFQRQEFFDNEMSRMGRDAGRGHHLNGQGSARPRGGAGNR